MPAKSDDMNTVKAEAATKAALSLVAHCEEDIQCTDKIFQDVLVVMNYASLSSNNLCCSFELLPPEIPKEPYCTLRAP